MRFRKSKSCQRACGQSLVGPEAAYECRYVGGLTSAWQRRDGNVVVQKQSSIEQNEYLKSLEEGLPAPSLSTEMVRYWSDFNRVYYSPKSIVQLNDFDLNSRLMPFERWDVGEDLFGDLDREHDLLDRDLRPFAEECDQIQGLQVMTAVDDAWGGFAARYIDRIRDDFGKTSIWVWALEDGKNGQRVCVSLPIQEQHYSAENCILG